MAIDPALNAAVLTAANTLQTATLIPATITLRALAGACQMANATCATVSLEAVINELLHILAPHPIVIANNKHTEWGYTQAEVHAFS